MISPALTHLMSGGEADKIRFFGVAKGGCGLYIDGE